MPRNRAWADFRYKGVSLVAGTDIISDLLTNAPDVDTLTAVRIVGYLNVGYVVTNAIVDADSVVDVGIGVSAKEAVSAGGSSLPDAQSVVSYPPRGWLYLATKYVRQSLTGTDGTTNSNAVFEFDLRAMRKVDKGTVFIRIGNANINVGGAMEVTGRVRVLCLT